MSALTATAHTVRNGATYSCIQALGTISFFLPNDSNHHLLHDSVGMNAEMTGNYTPVVEEVTNKATKDFDQYVNTQELKQAESQLTKRDTQIAELQAKLDPETLKNDIMSRYSKSLSSGALDALYYDEANDKNKGLQTLLAQKEMAQAEYKRIREENLQRYEVVKQNEQQVVSSLMANGGLGLSSTSFKDIDQYVKD